MITSIELTKLLSLVGVEQLGRWYCDLSVFRKPANFPFDLGEPDRLHRKSPAFQLAWRCVADALGHEGCSRAWWMYELRHTEEEWRAWWNGGACNGPSPVRDDAEEVANG